MQQGQKTENDRRRDQGADTSDLTQGVDVGQARAQAIAGGIAHLPEARALGALGLGLMALLWTAQVANQSMRRAGE